VPHERDRHQSFMDTVLTNNVILAEQPDRELIVGCISKFHQVFDQEFVPIRDAEGFRRFLHQDYQKLAMSFRVSGDDPKAGCTLTLEYRTHAMSEHARKQFARYWLAIKPGGGFASQQLLRAIKRHAEVAAGKNLSPSETLPVRVPQYAEPMNVVS